MARALWLTPPQIELLTDLATHPLMYILQWSRWDKTAVVLIRHGLAARTPGSSYNNQYEITITEAGREESARRGIGAPQSEAGASNVLTQHS